ncbi:hypothetical protein WHR41_00234 [Cladosporium halotolerans]|uniref:Uncharacterized protein n=1 Tax=Cladosporium halotolerans TaxID=1052096 RepID=A0AB34L8D7_9PEZI
MSNLFARRRSVPSAAHVNVDDLFEKLKQHDPEWLSSTLSERWNQISERGSDFHIHESSDATASPRRPLLNRLKRRSQHSIEALVKPIWTFDVTASKLPQGRTVPDHVALIRNHDWSSTELGPMSSWSDELRRLVNTCLLDPRPAAVWWLKSRIMIYNEGYALILGKRHPGALGMSLAAAWPELVGSFDQHFNNAEELGQSASGDNAFYITERNGFCEELWASWAIMPVPAENGGTGFYNAVFETTKQVMTERRMSTLMLLGRCTTAAKGTQDFWKQAVKGLDPNHYDVPFAALYAAASPDTAMHRPNVLSEQWEATSQTSKTSSDPSSSFSSRQWTLEGMLGLPPSCKGLPSRIDSDAAAESLSPLLRQALSTGKIMLLTYEDDTFPQGLRGVARSRAFEDECMAAVLCPVGPTNRENPLGFMLIGINPRCAYDSDYKTFISILSRQMATSIASVVLAEEELKRSRDAAELATQDRIRMSEQLAVTKQEAKETEVRFRRMTELSPMAMFHFDELGNVLYANEEWFELTQHPRNAFYPLSWYSVIHEDDHELMDREWAKLTSGEPVHFELRLKRPFTTDETLSGEQIEGDTWILAAAYADKREDATVAGVLGCLTDISRQKWAEGFQARRTEEAMELKRQQENFMDMTSHEARNPLSAITLCAESITTALKELLDNNRGTITLDRDALETHLEGAEIIVACAQHQKRIIDDVLTLSKLDSGLLVICPVEVQPVETIKQALRMFDSELLKSDITLEYHFLPSYYALNLDWLRLDPSRLLQILINLLTNAIKFTANCNLRKITVSVGASVQCPENFCEGMKYLADPNVRSPLSPRADEDIYLSIEIKDTGRGISPEEMTRLFQRWGQASPRTSIKYGGSGLGLFISRELASRQGGQIGFTSESGVGSTFAFYVQAQRCGPPQPKTARQTFSTGSGSNVRRRSKASIFTAAATTEEQTQSHVTHEFATQKVSELDDLASTELHLLVVEDNLVNQKVVAKQLVRAGYTVAVANHGHEALAHIRKTSHANRHSGIPLHLVLMDVEMPIMDGLACARQIREMEAQGSLQGHIPIVAVTANARAEQQAAALEAGMDSVVTKPFRMLELLPELERVRKMFAT